MPFSFAGPVGYSGCFVTPFPTVVVWQNVGAGRAASGSQRGDRTPCPTYGFSRAPGIGKNATSTIAELDEHTRDKHPTPAVTAEKKVP